MKKSGFTLIELLVVIAIIAILAAILFPIFTKAKGAATTSSCISNMKQMSAAINLYRDSNYGNLPQANNIWYIKYSKPTSTFQYHYYEALSTYLKSTSLAICRGKPSKPMGLSLAELWYFPTGKVTRWWGAVYTPSMWPYRKVAGDKFAHMVWSQGSRTVNLDTVDYYGSYNCNPSQAVMLFCLGGTLMVNWDDANIKKMFPDGVSHGSHDTGTPALFADGHVKFLAYDQVGNL